jgi:hypothetical protein
MCRATYRNPLNALETIKQNCSSVTFMSAIINLYKFGFIYIHTFHGQPLKKIHVGPPKYLLHFFFFYLFWQIYSIFVCKIISFKGRVLALVDSEEQITLWRTDSRVDSKDGKKNLQLVTTHSNYPRYGALIPNVLVK